MWRRLPTLTGLSSWTPRSPGPSPTAVETYRLMERYEEALSDFNRAIELDPSDSWAIAHRGETGMPGRSRLTPRRCRHQQLRPGQPVQRYDHPQRYVIRILPGRRTDERPQHHLPVGPHHRFQPLDTRPAPRSTSPPSPGDGSSTTPAVAA